MRINMCSITLTRPSTPPLRGLDSLPLAGVGGVKCMAKDIGAILAIIHMGLLASISGISANAPSSDPEYIWLLFIILDFPFSLGYLVFEKYTDLDKSLLFTHIYFSVIGTIWWYYLPIFISFIARKIISRG